jgi:hypothetical protein
MRAGLHKLAAAQALGVAQIRHVLYNGHVLRPEEKQLRSAGVRNGHELVVIVDQADRPSHKSVQDSFEVGERVQRRDHGEAWGTGYVTSTAPLRVSFGDDDSQEGCCCWDEVQKLHPVRNSDVIHFDVGADSLFDSTSDSESESNSESAHLTSAALTLTLSAASNGDEVKIEQLASAAVPSPDPRSGGGDLLFKEGDTVTLAPTASARSSQHGPLNTVNTGTIVAVDRLYPSDDEPYQVLAGGDTYWYHSTDLVSAGRPSPVDDTPELPVRRAKSCQVHQCGQNFRSSRPEQGLSVLAEVAAVKTEQLPPMTGAGAASTICAPMLGNMPMMSGLLPGYRQPAVQQPPMMPSQPQKPKPRPQCMFGSNCYRKCTSPAGQEHRAQYSHPDDSDWTQSIPWVGTIDLSGEKIRTRTRRRARGDPVPTGGLHSPCMHSRVESFKRAKTEKDPMAYEADCFKADPEFVRVQCVWCCLFLTVPHLRRRQSLQRLARSLWSLRRRHLL